MRLLHTAGIRGKEGALKHDGRNTGGILVAMVLVLIEVKRSHTPLLSISPYQLNLNVDNMYINP